MGSKIKLFIRENFSIVIISFISLFLEFLVIRLVGTEIRIFAYLSNLILLAIFVGLGIGMFVKSQLSIIISSALLFLLTVVTSTNYIVRWPNLEFKLFTGITELLAPISESYIWLQLQTYSKTGIFIGIILTILLFILIMLIFMPLGQILGHLLSNNKKNPIAIYSLNIIASITGLWAYQVFSLARFTPYFGIILTLGTFIFYAKNQTEKLALLMILLISIAFITPRVEPKNIVYWSPYQKLSLSLALHDDTNINPQPEGRYLEVNNVGYMSLLDLSDKYQTSAQAKLNELYHDKPPIDIRFADQYSLPYKLKPDAKRVLIVGAGAGNDAAAALRSNIPQVDAVEIDPTIIEIGKKFHPEKPYSSPNMNVIVDDGRAYFERTDKKYDIVVMGLADSHTLSSSLTNLRLDHYLYTEESFQKVKDILADDGVLFLTFEVTRPWMGSRIEKGLTDVFGQKPQIFENRSQGVFGWGGYSFVVSKNPLELNNLLAHNPDLAKFIDLNRRDFSIETKTLTDDWPYLYLDKPRLPAIHVLVALILGGSLFLLRKRFLGQNGLNIPMFFWGAAFLLFEFQNISKTSLLFGITWVTNLFTISAILCLILLANITVSKKLVSPKMAFVFLIISISIQFLVPINYLNTWELWRKIILGSLLLNLPVYFGGIIFTNMFAQAKNRASAFGANFLGAVFGGFAETLTFLTGIHSLLILVIIFYTLGFISNYTNILPKFKLPGSSGAKI